MLMQLKAWSWFLFLKWCPFMLRALRGLLPRATMPDKEKALTFVRGKIADHKAS
jgi:hypothetical protein